MSLAFERRALVHPSISVALNSATAV